MTRLRLAGRRKALVFRLGIPLGALLAFAIPGAPAHAQVTGQWQPTGSMATGHGNWYNSGFAQLPDGRVLAISGSSSPGTLTPAAEIYDPGTGQWTSAGTLNDARYAFGPPSVLPDGDVLVAGGHDINVVDYATAELYDPATNQWTRTGSLNTARRYPIQAELANGEVLVATGSLGAPTCTRYLSSAELYNPATGHWTYTGSTLVPRESATAIRLADGRVLLAGGYNGGGGACRDTAPVDTEVYDPATGHWSFAGNLPHGWLAGTMVLLSDGRVLMVDGYQQGSSAFAEAVIFDPATNQWSEAAAPVLPRAGAAATLLPDGKVLVSQGSQQQSEIYDPVANTWTLDATTLDENNGGRTFLLPDGQVLLAGGGNSTGPVLTAELYTSASSDDDLAIAAHADITTNATGPTGATVSFSPPAVTDPDDATAPVPGCSPASGSLFPVGTTTVSCTATDPDDSNGPVTTSFAVNVEGAAAQLADLHQAVTGVGPGNSLAAKIAQAQAYVAAGDSTDAVSTLTAFINQVNAQAGKSIPASQAAQFIAAAKQIQAVLGPAVSCNAFGGAYQLPGAHGVVPAAYSDPGLTVPACGPLPGTGGGPMVYAYPGSSYFAGYQCVEFAERFLYYKDGVTMGGGTNGDEVVAKYATQYPSMFTAVANGTPNAAPVKGDVLSLSTLSTFNSSDGGHTAVVQSSNVNSAGNGSLTLVDENGTAAGVEIATVTNWTVAYASFPYIEWLHLR
jgi:hypothetical protein